MGGRTIFANLQMPAKSYKSAEVGCTFFHTFAPFGLSEGDERLYWNILRKQYP